MRNLLSTSTFDITYYFSLYYEVSTPVSNSLFPIVVILPILDYD